MPSIEIPLHGTGMRRCGDCQLCCKLVPIADTAKPENGFRPFRKAAGVRCKHQRFKKGCAIHGTQDQPHSCRIWSCRWLLNADTADLPRPDRAGYVIDMMPDFVVRVGDDGERDNIPVIQVWIEPWFDAEKDDALKAFMLRRAAEGCATILRINNVDAITVFPPPMMGDRWVRVQSRNSEKLHTAQELIDVFKEKGMALL